MALRKEQVVILTIDKLIIGGTKEDATKMMIKYFKNLASKMEELRKRGYLIHAFHPCFVEMSLPSRKKIEITASEFNPRILERSTKELGLSNKTYHCLINRRIETLEQLTKMSEKEVLLIRRIGPDSLNEIKEALAKLHLTLDRRF